MDKRHVWIQVLAIQHNLTPEQTEQLEATIRQAAEVMQTSFEAMALAVRNIVLHAQESPDWQALEEFNRRYNLPAPAYRSRLPSEQGYNRTEYDRWRNSLGQGRGKRKR